MDGDTGLFRRLVPRNGAAIPFTIDEAGHRHYKVECVH